MLITLGPRLVRMQSATAMIQIKHKSTVMTPKMTCLCSALVRCMVRGIMLTHIEHEAAHVHQLIGRQFPPHFGAECTNGWILSSRADATESPAQRIQAHGRLPLHYRGLVHGSLHSPEFVSPAGRSDDI